MSLDERLERYRQLHPERSVDARAGRFLYTVGGAGERTVLVLHGGGSTAEATHAFCLALEPALRVIAIDWPASVRTVDDVADGIDAVLRAEGAGRFSLLGFSMGGMIAQCIARAAPERVDRLVLYVSMGPSAAYAHRFRRYLRVLSLVPDAWLRAASKRAVTKWLSEAVGDAPELGAALERVAAHRAWMFDSGRVSKATLLSDARVLVDYFSRTDFEPAGSDAWDGKVMIFEGARDRMVGEAERAELRRLYPRAEVVRLDEDHFAGVLAPDEVTSRMRRFLSHAP